MKTIHLSVSEEDLKEYNLGNGQEIQFSDLISKISLEYARKALAENIEIAKKVGLSEMTLDEINAEIIAIRNAKSNT